VKLYIWQNTKGTNWYIHLDYDHPLGRQLRGKTRNLFTRTPLSLPGQDQTAHFRMNPRTGVGELFMNMRFYQFLLEQDHRDGNKEYCILQSVDKWLIQTPNLTTI